VPLASEVRVRGCCDVSRTSEAGRWLSRVLVNRLRLIRSLSVRYPLNSGGKPNIAKGPRRARSRRPDVENSLDTRPPHFIQADLPPTAGRCRPATLINLAATPRVDG
jgi:hypothetical protein